MNTDSCAVDAVDHGTITMIGSRRARGQQVTSEGSAAIGCIGVRFEFETMLEASHVYR